jgi:CubicO group peptidase (beta-lactamase class C family)
VAVHVLSYFGAALLLLCSSASAAAQTAPAYLVAGYRALFTCSATFLADRTAEQIERNDLTGIYRDYEERMAAQPAAVIDREKGVVSARWSESAPPRVARHNAPLGCTLLPPGADVSTPLPSVQFKAPSAAAAELEWPLGDGLRRAPLGVDPFGKPLSRVLARAFDGKTYGAGSRSSAVIVVLDGELIAEAYSLDSGLHVPQRTWSVAKTIMAALIGIAAADRVLRPEEPVALPQWSRSGDPRGSIRVLDLLHMASGLDSGPAGSRTDRTYFGGARVEDTALTRTSVAPPGSRWFYANHDTLALSYALRARLDDDARYLAFPYQRLFYRIGMRRTTAETDWAGTYILSSQVWTTARDLARFGVLLLNDGVWSGERLLPEGWLKLMTSPAPVQPPLRRGDGSALPGYGAHVWLFGERHGLPEGTFAAIGNRGQFLIVIPARRAVVVRRGYDPETGPFDIARFTASVLEALGE